MPHMYLWHYRRFVQFYGMATAGFQWLLPKLPVGFQMASFPAVACYYHWWCHRCSTWLSQDEGHYNLVFIPMFAMLQTKQNLQSFCFHRILHAYVIQIYTMWEETKLSNGVICPCIHTKAGLNYKCIRNQCGYLLHVNIKNSLSGPAYHKNFSLVVFFALYSASFPCLTV